MCEAYDHHICVDISYETEGGMRSSDLCFCKKDLSNEHRRILHLALDEWLNNADGTGQFRLWHDDSVMAAVLYNEGMHDR